MNFKRVLCPVALSPASREPLRYAAALASAYSAQLFICHCASARSNDPKDVDSLRVQIKQLLRDNLQAGPEMNGCLNWEALIVAGHNPGAAIVAEAARQQIDLIVMSPKRRAFRARLLGSTAKQVCRSAPCSVLIAHPNDRNWVASAGVIKLKRILVAYDYSEFAQLALQQAILFARQHGSEIHLVHVLTEQGPDSPELRWERHEWVRVSAHKRLRLAVPFGDEQSLKITYSVIEGGASSELLAYAEREEVDLVAIGARGACSRMRPLLGSNVGHVLQSSRCPVLVARTPSLGRGSNYDFRV